ncbi:b(0,+)-type amino acid transporter 1-like isoform X2 [Pollicipes pollicipes]|uniref:b(0,+)-type amino acid transporter 1-like isoform X1 n=1 Tax=Pollicipes pollicipes TaxID=41117 RepID=UPI0018856DA1|nr:b(0,+)-type amino acid transporter 1-like isoform X1 [Pollicipes pollicipes]XP_037075083.1 b(0,+)-type amino acid transporter 1-like isoform X2 [Pollicipes pollicipes]XP_037075127.1 b(0,+)-type amino acid transporter 1-like isoform X3 [Pollicipes pollicipes]XP_037077548.1 b(0,+)-type amino acid transporter 1-like isoform X2 [Pollicipes pollicipes]
MMATSGEHRNGSVQKNGSTGQLSDVPEGKAGDLLAPPAPDAGDSTHLERRVGLFSGTALIVGTMIGSGIFVSPKGVLERTGSVGLSLVVWAGCGVLSMLGALAYAELGTLIPSSGAEYVYLLVGLGPLPAFVFSWVCSFVLKPSMLAIICLSFAEYLVEAFVEECEPPAHVVTLVGILTIGVITFINCFSVRLATKVQNVFTAAKLFAIGIIVIGGMYSLAEGNTQYLRQGFQHTTTSVSDVATAFYSGLWAYDGWNNLNYVTEEIKNPSRNLPLAIIIGLPLVTACYLLVNISYLAVMSPVELLQSDAVAVTFGNRILGVMSWLMPLAVTLSTFGAANGTCFTSGRLCYAAARQGHLVDVLSFVHVRRLTPSPALIFNAIIAIAMIAAGDIGSLIDFFSFTVWIFYGMAMLALIMMRRTKPDAPRPYKVPIVIPWLVLFMSVYLVVGPIIDAPQIEYLYALAFVLAGPLVYIPFVHYKWTPGFIHKITLFLQKLFEVVPTSYDD